MPNDIYDMKVEGRLFGELKRESRLMGTRQTGEVNGAGQGGGPERGGTEYKVCSIL